MREDATNLARRGARGVSVIVCLYDTESDILKISETFSEIRKTVPIHLSAFMAKRFLVCPFIV